MGPAIIFQTQIQARNNSSTWRGAIWRVCLGSCIALGLTLSVASQPASAQVSAGLASISGIVNDAGGAVVPKAQVVVSNPSLGVNLMLETSAGGVFNAPSL